MNKTENNKSIILTEGMYSDSGIIAFILTIALKFSKPNQKIFCFQTPGSAKVSKLTNLKSIITVKYEIFLITFFIEIVNVIKIFSFVKKSDFKKINELFSHEDINCSNEFQDTLAIKKGIFWYKNNKYYLFILITYEFLFFKFLSRFFLNHFKQIDLVIIGDTAYRYGYFAKISGKYNIPLICNLDLNSIYFNYYANGYRFKNSRPILPDLFDSIKLKYPNYSTLIQNYFSDRFSGKIIQHDVLSAYTNVNINSLKLVDQIPKDKIVVSLFAHVFSDAPHNIPGLLFDDFYTWFNETLEALIINKNVFVLIKEHPSAHLYNVEKGLIGKLINDKFSDSENIMIVKNASPTEIIGISDFVITGSGTIIYECLFNKKNLIIASKTTFSKLDTLFEFDDKIQYLNFLKSLSSLNLKSVNLDFGEIISFYHFFIFNNRDIYVDFPLRPYVRGRDFNVSRQEFKLILDYVTSNSKFSTDLDEMISNRIENFVPKILID